MNETSSSGIFLRPASGLIKSASMFDVFIYNVGLISIGIGIAYTHSLGPLNYPGGNIPFASLLATVLMMTIGWALWCWTVSLPRSGGIYVFVTRTFGPGLGFVASFVESMCWLSLNAAAGVLVSTVAVAPLLTRIALSTGDLRVASAAVFFQTPLAQFICGSVLIVFSGAILVLGMRRYFLVQKMMFVLAMAGTLLMIYLLATHSHADFVRQFSDIMVSLGPNPYQSVLEGAKAAGWKDAPFSLFESIRLLVWPFLALIGGAFSIAIGGEVRQVRKNQAVGILGSILFCGLIFATIGALSYSSIGSSFQSAVAYTNAHAPTFSTPTAPYISLLVDFLSPNPVVWVAIAVSFLAWIYFWVPGMLAYAQRSMLAWSFDRLAPEQFGDVSERFHTPVTAIVITTVISIGILYLYVFTSLFPTLTFILAACSAWLVATVAGCVYPFTRKRLFELSPIAYQKVFGVPTMVLANGLASLSLVFIITLLWNDPIAAGHGPNSLGTVIALYGLGSILYFAMRRFRARQGIDPSLATKEIPIE